MVSENGAAPMSAADRRAAGMGDDETFLLTMNQAQLVVLDEAGLLPAPLVAALADAVNAIAAEPAAAPTDYLEYEKQLVARVGPEASNLHLGRSRNDLGATRERMWLRHGVFDVVDRLVTARRRLLDVVDGHGGVVIAAYTHAVQAQPISLGHYLLALDSALARDADRLRGAYSRVDQSPLGAGALATSGFPLDRRRLAELVGFGALCENSYDCIGVASADTKLELAGVLSCSAVAIGRFCQDLVIQQAAPRPTLTFGAELTGGSSIMPQKRNPKILEQLRSTCSRLVGEAGAVTAIAHNTPFGDVADVRGVALDKALDALRLASRMYDLLGDLFGGLVVDADACRRQVEADYSTMTELADRLHRQADVPFRVGHEVAKRLTAYGRARGRGPLALTVDEVATVYREVAGLEFPLDGDDYRTAVDPAGFVSSRRGVGGPQPAEVARMVAGHRAELSELAAWRGDAVDRVNLALRDLHAAVEARRRRVHAVGDGEGS